MLIRRQGRSTIPLSKTGWRLLGLIEADDLENVRWSRLAVCSASWVSLKRPTLLTGDHRLIGEGSQELHVRLGRKAPGSLRVTLIMPMAAPLLISGVNKDAAKAAQSPQVAKERRHA